MFAGAEAPKTAAQVAKYGGVQGEQLDPCYHEACDTYATVTGQPPADTMNVYENDPTPANLAIAQQQANSLQRQRAAVPAAVQGHARARRLVLRANKSNAFPAKASAARARKVAKRTARFKYRGHRVARTR